MSYLGTREQAKADCKAADMQLDGNDSSHTSPVQKGSSEVGAAPMDGQKEFTKERTRTAWHGNQGAMKKSLK